MENEMLGHDVLTHEGPGTIVGLRYGYVLLVRLVIAYVVRLQDGELVLWKPKA